MTLTTWIRRAAIATAALSLMVSDDLQAQSTSSSAADPPPPVRDFEEQPPTKLGTKLDPASGWSESPRPAMLRTQPKSRFMVSTHNCDVRVQNDWLRLKCKGAVGRVNQLAGATENAVVHISHQREPDAKGKMEDKRRLLLFVRLVPGEISLFEVTSIEDGYNSDWEGPVSLVSVDWSNTDRGPRIIIQPEQLSYF